MKTLNQFTSDISLITYKPNKANRSSLQSTTKKRKKERKRKRKTKIPSFLSQSKTAADVKACG